MAGADLAVGVADADPAPIGLEARSARGVQVVTQGPALFPEHAPGRVDGARDLHTRQIFRNDDQVACLEHDVVARVAVPQRAGQVHVDPTHLLRGADEPDATGIGERREATGAVNHVRQPILPRDERVGARKPDLSQQLDRLLERERRLLQDEHVVVRLERHLRRAAARKRRSRWPEIAARRVAADEVRRIERHTDGLGELALGTIRREPGDLHLFQVRAYCGTAGLLHQVPQRHPRAPGVAAGLRDCPGDRDVERRFE